MRIAIIGYGKMGRLVEQCALQLEHTIVAKIGPNEKYQSIDEKSLGNADVCIDFTNREVVLDNIKQVASLGKNMIVGTTGWFDHLDIAKEIVKKHQTGLLYAANFSIGMNIFLKVLEETAKLMNEYPEYDVAGFEAHHNEKIDAPSGAAKSITSKILNNIERKTRIVYNLGDRKIEPDELHFASMRCGYIPGTHSVVFDSSADTITLTHQARNREGFAMGAVRAAEWLQGKKGFYTIQDMIG